tara:strand:- start:730 stop:1017 length:288 start_codon:yes stop_codon:yes gene_type:complete
MIILPLSTKPQTALPYNFKDMKMNKTRKYKRNFDKMAANLMVIKIYEDLLHGFIDKDTKELKQVPADGPAGKRYKQLMEERNARPFATRRRRVIL